MRGHGEGLVDQVRSPCRTRDGWEFRSRSARRARRPRWGVGRSSSARPTGGRRSWSPWSRGRRSAGSASMPVRASGEKLARSSMARRSSSSQSMVVRRRRSRGRGRRPSRRVEQVAARVQGLDRLRRRTGRGQEAGLEPCEAVRHGARSRVHGGRRPSATSRVRVVEHVGAIAGQGHLEEAPDEGRAARRRWRRGSWRSVLEALEDALHQVSRLGREPVAALEVSTRVRRLHRPGGGALGTRSRVSAMLPLVHAQLRAAASSSSRKALQHPPVGRLLEPAASSAVVGPASGSGRSSARRCARAWSKRQLVQ